MAVKETRVEVEINGEYYKLKGEESPEHMIMVSQHVDRVIKQVIARNPKLPYTSAAVLAAVNIASELTKLQQDYDNLVRMMDTDSKD
ncbi:cell division protein ZapA [Desulfofalx alkaliphila]|uniref:cell division protein ZapA n=1 Tax=Desulfofalx alkaliphila TaxID=105483 RepID=UPI0004E211E2|nr:cell division protein ZapA [Desulfofalx alkaliphila]